jgi:hypothetical protein
MNIAPRKEDQAYTYSLRVGGKLCLLIGVRPLLLLNSGSKNHPPHDLHMFKFIYFSPHALWWVKVMGTFPKCKVGLVLGGYQKEGENQPRFQLNSHLEYHQVTNPCMRPTLLVFIRMNIVLLKTNLFYILAWSQWEARYNFQHRSL